MPDAHTQTVTLHIIEAYPSHPPRQQDPHYHFFNQARARLKRLGKLVCWINNHECAGEIELHHDKIEFALQQGVDIRKFEECYPELHIESDDDFLRVIESEGSLTPYCRQHHTGLRGVHVLPWPLFLPQKFWKDDLASPAVLITGPASVEVPAGAAAVVEAVTP